MRPTRQDRQVAGQQLPRAARVVVLIFARQAVAIPGAPSRRD
jgi:hypothetical protein